MAHNSRAVNDSIEVRGGLREAAVLNGVYVQIGETCRPMSMSS
jgi:hypothetical protein